ncbi:MAG TPA: RimK family alpha-L-glutamate ligase [Clostridia bacterium]|mgnify:CR=1 FL=1|jgi:gamma-F420-2:alpha-L-glutamate ligase|nr:RimK family alpha-L-glutamate ligase [Clostridia bacterium]HOL61677.1 RimK family alpha-L-glutamate ligase [Clostridia bacterium]HPO54180.1 RimK family alpha-L-glutamate ligase [Clostridia bacterium]
MDLAVITNGFYTSESTLYQLRRLTEECEKRGIRLKEIRNARPWAPSDFEDIPKKCIFLDKDICLAEELENKGVRLYNRARAIGLADNKIKTQIALQGLIQFPKTLFSPLRYRGAPALEELSEVENRIGYPVVIKEASGSLGQQVYLAKDRKELAEITSKIEAKAHLYQQAVSRSFGRSVRVFVVGGKSIGAVKYINDKDFRSNMEEGGRVYPAEPGKAHITAAEEGAKALRLDFCAIDFFDTEEPLAIEVNSNAFFRGFEALGINIASHIIEHIVAAD